MPSGVDKAGVSGGHRHAACGGAAVRYVSGREAEERERGDGAVGEAAAVSFFFSASGGQQGGGLRGLGVGVGGGGGGCILGAW